MVPVIRARDQFVDFSVKFCNITVASVGGRNSQGDSEINQLSNLSKHRR